MALPPLSTPNAKQSAFVHRSSADIPHGGRGEWLVDSCERTRVRRAFQQPTCSNEEVEILHFGSFGLRYARADGVLWRAIRLLQWAAAQQLT
jgi:hypothetical protein